MSRTRLFAPLLVAVMLVGCGEDDTTPEFALGDARSGREHIFHLGCTACHVIPGVPGVKGRVGPSLEAFAERRYIAGTLPNNPVVLLKRLQDAPDLVPRTAMPDLPVGEKEARDIAAYLYTLR